MISLRCSHIIVTGGGSGIGKAIAARLLRGGARVVIAGRHMDRLREAERELASDSLYCMEWDVSRAGEAEEHFERAKQLMGGFDGLVNNAALGTSQATGRGYEPWDITPEEWDRLMDVNLKAAFFNMRTAVDIMRREGVRRNIPMKSSGIDWIGEMPNDWKLIPFRHVLYEQILSFEIFYRRTRHFAFGFHIKGSNKPCQKAAALLG